jgi:hypothetical protein
MDPVALSCELLPADKRQLASSVVHNEEIGGLDDRDNESLESEGVKGGGGLDGVEAKRLTPEWAHGQTVTGIF